MPAAHKELSLPANEHRPGCPADRIERDIVTRPATDKRPAGTFLRIRCIDCGGQITEEARDG